MHEDELSKAEKLDSREIASLWPTTSQIGPFAIPEIADCRRTGGLDSRASKPRF